jgi:hypothetical protein
MENGEWKIACPLNFPAQPKAADLLPITPATGEGEGE